MPGGSVAPQTLNLRRLHNYVLTQACVPFYRKKLESSDGSEATSYARSPFNEANGDAKENLHQDQGSWN